MRELSVNKLKIIKNVIKALVELSLIRKIGEQAGKSYLLKDHSRNLSWRYHKIYWILLVLQRITLTAFVSN